MPLLAKFDTPGKVRDVDPNDDFYNEWSRAVGRLIAPVLPGNNGGAFYDPTETDVLVAGDRVMTWMGLPRDQFLPRNRDNKTMAYRLADGDVHRRSTQNEYFEWKVDRNDEGKIRKVTFVTELPEYYETLWDNDPDKVRDVYRNVLNNNQIQTDELKIPNSDRYDKFNRWNTNQGIVHLIQNINNLRAAMNLVRGSLNQNPVLNNNFEPNTLGAFTSVDARVALDLNMLIRKGLYVTLKDPVGIYISDWDGSSITHPDGSPAGDYWNATRGHDGYVMRLEYEVPSHLPFVVEDLKLGGRPIEYGGQLAEQITVSITGTAGTPNPNKP